VKQRRVDEFLELLDALGDHRVGNALAGSLGEALCLGDPDKRLRPDNGSEAHAASSSGSCST
jgi:hypothetical protein